MSMSVPSYIVVLNCGSSSIKFGVFEASGSARQPAWNGKVQGIGGPHPDFGARTVPVRSVDLGRAHPYAAALQIIRDEILCWLNGRSIAAIAHRVVHGGAKYFAPTRVDEQVLAELKTLIPLAPLHQPFALEAIEILLRERSDLPQFACFDTAFHHTLPPVEQLLPLPHALAERGLRRYGFHGLSYQYVMSVLHAQTLRGRGRVVMAHLGNGASLCACKDGVSVATTMGFSALDGLMMGTRSGSLDAGVLLYLLEQGWDHGRIEKLLYKQSGLLGVSGISADMRTLRADGSADAQRAIAQFTHRVVRETGALIACLDGLDVLAFSGGIGENDAVLREQVCNRLAWTGLRIDAQRNRQADGHAAWAIHAPDSRVEIWVVPTDEGRVAAREAAALLESGQALDRAAEK